ncbi:hypothetical protein BDV06DRAFT_216739 [Aspergillus oleicola]
MVVYSGYLTNLSFYSLGQKYATLVNLAFTSWCYLTPLLGAIVADQYFGRSTTITYATGIYAAGLFLLSFSSLPAFENVCVPLLALAAAMALIALNQPVEQPMRKLKMGEYVYTDYEMTTQRIFMVFIMMTNMGSLSSLGTTIELLYGFSVAFLVPVVVFCLGTAVPLARRNTYVACPATHSVVLHAIQAACIGARNGCNLDAAKPMNAKAGKPYPGAETFIDELRCCLRAFISQAGNMATHGLPNDIMFAINPLAITGLDLGPIARVTTGFLYKIYTSPPCYSFSRSPDCNGGASPNDIHVAWQTPVYVLLAISEVFVSSTGLEYAYGHAPESMRSTVIAMFRSAYIVGSVLSMLVTPFLVDPLMTRVYLGLGVVTLLSGAVFWGIFRGRDRSLPGVCRR